MTYSRDNPHPFTLPMVMLDIETLGLLQNSKVYEIGALFFTGWPDFKEVAAQAWYLHMGDQEQRHFDPKTLAWTLEVAKQEISWSSLGPVRTARPRADALVDAARAGRSVERWLADYEDWVEHNWLRISNLQDSVRRDPCVWAWGPHFDIALIENALQEKNLRAPWKYDKPMDLRTLDRLLTLYKPDVPEKDKDQVPHDALGDCRLQFERFRLAFSILDGAITSSASRHM